MSWQNHPARNTEARTAENRENSRELADTGASCPTQATQDAIGPWGIRTHDQGIMSPLPAFDNTRLTASGAQVGADAENAASDGPAADLPPDLKALVTAWTNMPDAAKAAIQALCMLPQAGATATTGRK